MAQIIDKLMLPKADDVETAPGPDDLDGKISMILDIVRNINSKQDKLGSRVTRIEEDIKTLKLKDESIPSCKDAIELNSYMEENRVLKSELESLKKEKGSLERRLVDILKQNQTPKHLITELQNGDQKCDLAECELKSTEMRQRSELKTGVDSGVATCDKENLPDADAQKTDNTPTMALLEGGNESIEVHGTKDEEGDEFDCRQGNNSGDPSLEEETKAHDCTKLASVKRKYNQIAPHQIKHFQTAKESQLTNASASTKNSSLKDQNSACSLEDEINEKEVQPNSYGYQLFMRAQTQQDQSTDANVPTDFSPERKREETGDERKKIQTNNSDPTSPCILNLRNEDAVLENEKRMANKNQLTSEETYGLCSPSSEEPNEVVSGNRLTDDEELPLASVSGKLPYPIKETVNREIFTGHEYGRVNSYDDYENVDQSKRAKQVPGNCDVENQGRHGNKSQPYEIKQPSDKPKMQIKKGKEIPNKILQSIAKNIGSGWIDLMRALEIEESRLENIQELYKNLDERAFKGLYHWKCKLGSDATLDKLKAALDSVDRRDLRERLEADELA